MAHAFPIENLPFEETGTTVGFGWDATWSSPHCAILFEGADVFYSFVPDHDMDVEVDLCGTALQTRVSVLDSELAEVDCNDSDVCGPYHPLNPCGEFNSRLARVHLTGGQTYYIMVGHWAGTGPYVISVHEDLPRTVVCPVDGVDEGEPEIYDGYIDAYNCGCSGFTPPRPIQAVGLGESGAYTLCGHSGWPFSTQPDVDWFAIAAPATGILEVILASERPALVMQMAPRDCNTYAVQAWGLAGHGESTQVSVPVAANEPVCIVVTPRNCLSDFHPGTGAFDYVLTLLGPAVGTEGATWGIVKSLFR